MLTAYLLPVIALIIWNNSIWGKKNSLAQMASKNTAPSIQQDSATQEEFDEDVVFKTEEVQPEKPFAQIPALEPSFEPEQVDDANFTVDEEEETIQFNFNNAKLASLIDFIEQIHDVTFLTDDSIKQIQTQAGNQAKNLEDIPVSFSTNNPLTKRESWNLFVTFLDLAGLALVPGPTKDIYRIVNNNKAKGSALPTYIDVEPDKLPANDTFVRYVYILKNSIAKDILPVINNVRGETKSIGTAPSKSTSAITTFDDLNALIFTDKSSYIKSIMEIVQEFDKASLPETISVIKLTNADVEDVVKLYVTLSQKEDPFKRQFPGAKKEPTLFYFPEDVTLHAEPRTNTVIILGPYKGVERVEQFIRTYIDKEQEKPKSPLHVFSLQYTDATDMANILNNVSQFTPQFSKEAGQQAQGSVRNNEKFFKTMHFEAEKTNNHLLAKIDDEDVPYVSDIIQKLDVAQQQVALEVLIVDITNAKNKTLGAQIRNKNRQAHRKMTGSVNFQTSGLPSSSGPKGIQVDSNYGLLANLINLATGHQAGSTLISLGQNTNIWGILKMLQTETNAHVISNPFLVTSNKAEAAVSTGEDRRVQSGKVIIQGSEGQNTYETLRTKLEVKITPRINQDGIINLQITVTVQEFTSDTNNTESVAFTAKTIITNANLANQEILALGGLTQKKEADTESAVPLLGRLPVVGWLFKNKTQSKVKSNLLVFISPRLITPQSPELKDYTNNKVESVRETFDNLKYHPTDAYEPLHRWFFGDNEKSYSHRLVDDFNDKKYMGITPSSAPPSTQEPQITNNSSTKKKSTKKKSIMQFMTNGNEKGSSHD